MRYKIYAGLSGGFGGANYMFTENYNSMDEALKDAYQEELESWLSYYVEPEEE